MRLLRICCFIFYLVSSDIIFAQDSTIRRITWLPVPAFGYSPETKAYLGGVVMTTFTTNSDSNARKSNAKIEATYTWKRQAILELGWNLLSNRERWFFTGKSQLAYFPDLYYGIGANSPAGNETVFTSSRYIFDTNIFKQLLRRWYVGVRLRGLAYSNITYSSAIYWDELKPQKIIGFGLSLLYDSRNHLLTPTAGYYLLAGSTANFSTQNYLKITIDARSYKTWYKKTLAIRLYQEYTQWHKPTFFDFAFAGGDQFLRGYYFGRFRDNHLVTFQSEFRFPVMWRIGIALLGGISNLSNSTLFQKENFLPNYGIGLRYAINRKENINLRIDYARGKDNNSGFYIAFGESF